MDELTFHRALYRPGTLLDIGAHDGLLTVPLADLSGATVHAFEPLPAAFARLRQATAHLANVTLHQLALGAAPGEASLEVPSVAGVAQEQWASLAKDYAAIRRADPRVGEIARHPVRVARLDDLALSGITAIKLDVEGAEEEAILGAASTIARDRPAMTVEIEERHRIGSTRSVPSLLARLGLEGFYALDGAWHRAAGFDAARLQRASPSPASFEASDPYVFIFYFVPPDRRPELLRLSA